MLSIWVVIFAILAAMVFNQDDVYQNHNRIKSTLYIPLQRPIWGIFLSWVAYACLTDNAGNEIVNKKGFFEITKLVNKTSLKNFKLCYSQRLVKKLKTF